MDSKKHIYSYSRAGIYISRYECHESSWVLIIILFYVFFSIMVYLQLSLSIVSDSLRPHGLQYTRLPYPSPTPRALTRQTFVDKVMSLLFKMLSRLVITFLPRSKRLLISWLQSPLSVILEPKKIKSVTVSPSICHEGMGLDAMIFVR